MVRILFILIVSLLIAGCSTVEPKSRGPVAISSGKPSLATSTKNTMVNLGSKFKAYPYEPDHFDMIELQESENKEVPFTFFKLKF